MTPKNTPPYRADHVGSLLRPRKLIEAREARKRGDDFSGTTARRGG